MRNELLFFPFSSECKRSNDRQGVLDYNNTFGVVFFVYISSLFPKHFNRLAILSKNYGNNIIVESSNNNSSNINNISNSNNNKIIK